MSWQPDTAAELLIVGIACVSIAYFAHVILRRIDEGTILPLKNEMANPEYGMYSNGRYKKPPFFKSFKDYRATQRFFLKSLALFWKWGLGFVSVLMFLKMIPAIRDGSVV
ncbi:hypothetical protein [Sphingorhabdus sp. YGSMI21]|uniref:hypothetical protein n=1 Tax=Sphingorhabdus sp. YGSMI21 TaxID=2077182 RepID=UPI000C1E28B1|nr:hypothetical protein [Sphingorhabdus sp. YGSMI21]ATW03156.1 hypothetical protein CHN51_06060 [Sphingorhabdus sp. YGSMI21]